MNLSCYIIDDEPHAIDLLAAHIRRTPGLTLRGSSTRPVDGLHELSNKGPADLVFLDVDMPGLNGLQLAALLPPGPKIIFTTAFREHAVEAFEHNAADYLMKPVLYERFLKCLQKVRPAQTAAETGTIFVKTGTRGELQGIRTADILYVTAALNYVEIFFRDGKLITYLTLTELLAELPATAFARIHRSYLVNLELISKVGYSEVRLTGDQVLPIGRVYRQHFREQMKERSLVSYRDSAL